MDGVYAVATCWDITNQTHYLYNIIHGGRLTGLRDIWGKDLPTKSAL